MQSAAPFTESISSVPGRGGGRLKAVFGVVLGSYAVAVLVGLANGHFGWWGEERVQTELREQALAQLGSPASDRACIPGGMRLETTFGTISRVSFVKDLDRPLPAIVARQRIPCADRAGRVTERWVLLAYPDRSDGPPCLAVGAKEEIDSAARRCGFVARRFY